ncbi:MAG TPA: hypothetical protein VIP98_01110 [Microlunatus sp.]
MLGKVFIAMAGGALGYVLGAKAGRERYEQILDQARRVRRDPRVRQTASRAAEGVKDVAQKATEQAKDKIADAGPSQPSQDPPEPGSGAHLDRGGQDE